MNQFEELRHEVRRLDVEPEEAQGGAQQTAQQHGQRGQQDATQAPRRAQQGLPVSLGLDLRHLELRIPQHLEDLKLTPTYINLQLPHDKYT